MPVHRGMCHPFRQVFEDVQGVAGRLRRFGVLPVQTQGDGQPAQMLGLLGSIA